MLPAATIILSFLIGKNNLWGKRKWLVSIGLGVMFMLSVYAGDGMRESSLFNQLDLQTLTIFLIGTAASLAGKAIGSDISGFLVSADFGEAQGVRMVENDLRIK